MDMCIDLITKRRLSKRFGRDFSDLKCVCGSTERDNGYGECRKKKKKKSKSSEIQTPHTKESEHPTNRKEKWHTGRGFFFFFLACFEFYTFRRRRRLNLPQTYSYYFLIYPRPVIIQGQEGIFSCSGKTIREAVVGGKKTSWGYPGK